MPAQAAAASSIVALAPNLPFLFTSPRGAPPLYAPEPALPDPVVVEPLLPDLPLLLQSHSHPNRTLERSPPPSPKPYIFQEFDDSVSRVDNIRAFPPPSGDHSVLIRYALDAQAPQSYHSDWRACISRNPLQLRVETPDEQNIALIAVVEETLKGVVAWVLESWTGNAVEVTLLYSESPLTRPSSIVFAYPPLPLNARAERWTYWIGPVEGHARLRATTVLIEK